MVESTFVKTLCSICYEDLKPIIEDLQSISICGHVFHELCLQQWFEYCPKGKKRSCPVCKQICTASNVGRLYFQSTWDPGLSQKSNDNDPEELRREVIRLEAKVSNLSSALEQRQKEFKQVTDELCTCKEKLKVEMSLKSELLSQKLTTQQLLRRKSEELDMSAMERMRLQERNMALAKELAALKLASDLNLEEEEVLKLASFGHDAGGKETVDILRRSLVIRNKSYKELMVKCNLLGRGEARSIQKLEKAKERIQKLKLRVQELEMTIEANDNKDLRVLKASKLFSAEVVPYGFDKDSKIKKSSLEEKKMKLPAKLQVSSDETCRVPDNFFCSNKMKRSRLYDNMYSRNAMDDSIVRSAGDQIDRDKGCFLINEDEDMVDSALVHNLSSGKTDHEEAPFQDCNSPRDATSEPNYAVQMQQLGNEDEFHSSHGEIKGQQDKNLPTPNDDDAICYGDNTSSHIGKETSKSITLQGKWCKKVQSQGSITSSTSLQGSTPSTGNLIAVGADGRGGRVKVLRSFGQSSSIKENKNTSWANKSKQGGKINGLKSQGRLQIEHFFHKTVQ